MLCQRSRKGERGGERVVNRRGRETGRYVEMDFYRVSEEVGAREPARVEVNFVSFIGIPVSYRRTSRLVPRISPLLD